MAEIDKEGILQSLSGVRHPVTGAEIATEPTLYEMTIKDGHIGLSLFIDPAHAQACEALRLACEQRIAGLAGVSGVTVVLTAHQGAPKGAGAAKGVKGAKEAQETKGGKPPAIFGQIGATIAIASGKGGVGKSTLAYNLAAALAARGKRTGLLDADIFGPSLPQLLGVQDKPEIDAARKICPIHKYGLHAMSIGFMVAPDQPLAWRGPMVQSAMLQMLNDVAWPALDIMVIDLPPGTGDIQLTMAQQIPVTGAMIVTTPQALAVADVRRSIAMLQKIGTPIMGVVENMAWMFAPDGETRLYPFGEGGGQLIAGQMNCPFLGQLPLDPIVQDAANHGQPVNIYDKTSPASEAFDNLAGMVDARLAKSEI